MDFDISKLSEADKDFVSDLIECNDVNSAEVIAATDIFTSFINGFPKSVFKKLSKEGFALGMAIAMMSAGRRTPEEAFKKLEDQVEQHGFFKQLH